MLGSLNAEQFENEIRHRRPMDNDVVEHDQVDHEENEDIDEQEER